jgi:fibronectin type 3 domain-containing protein
VYWGTSPRTYQQSQGQGVYVTSPSYVVNNLTSGRTYYFAVTAYDAAGLESAFSAEAVKAIP